MDETSSETTIGKDREDLEKELLVHMSDSIEEINDDEEDITIAQFSESKSEGRHGRNDGPTIHEKQTDHSEEILSFDKGGILKRRRMNSVGNILFVSFIG